MGVEVIGFMIFAASMVGTPGPANMVLMSAGAGYGLRRALPFVAGVALGKQLIIWPIGFGLIGLATQFPIVFATLKWASVTYVLWLAWRIARGRIRPGNVEKVPGFFSGLIVHPLNPKAWALVATGFTAFVAPGTDPLIATAWIAGILLATQTLMHPIWTVAGQAIANTLVGTRGEKYLMWILAGLTLASVIVVLLKGAG